jgi:molybdopterin biosynthesis enzyme
MDQSISVAQFQEKLLELAQPLAAIDLPLLDAHGATLASNLMVDDQPLLQSGDRIGATQIGLAASLGLDRLPCRPHPRVVIISAGDDLVEPGSALATEDDEFESNSWFLTTFVREIGAHAFRVHTIPETHDALKLIVEDQLVRADLIVISGESHDESFELINSVISTLGEIETVKPKLAESGKHSFGLIGPDKTPVIALPGEPIGNYLSAELFLRPIILKMLGHRSIYRSSKKLKMVEDVIGTADEANYLRAKFSGEKEVDILKNQSAIATISAADCLVYLSEKNEKISKGESAEVIFLHEEML